MGSILDPVLIGELGFLITAIMQLMKSHPQMKGSSVPWLSGIVGVVACLLWYLSNGELIVTHSIDWIHLYQGFANGVVSAVASIIGYNVQKALPTPNILPTSQELAEQRLQEDATQAAVENAEDAGIPGQATTVTADIQATAKATVETTTTPSTDVTDVVDEQENMIG